MKQTANDTKRLEALYRLYSTLAHEVLPEIILSENVDERLMRNSAGEGLLSEAGTAALPDTAQPDGPETVHAVSQSSIANQQEENRLDMDLADYEDDIPPFGETLDPIDAEGYTLEEEVADDFYGVDEDDDFDTDAAYNEYDATDDDLEDEEDEAEEADVDGLISELESMLELHTLGQAYDNPDEAFLADTWREAWFQTELEDYPANTGYTLRRLNEQGYEIIQFAFPKPVSATGSWQAIAIRRAGEPYRYFTLDNTAADKEQAVLVEWEVGGKHTNHGVSTYEASDPKVFLNLVLEKLA